MKFNKPHLTLEEQLTLLENRGLIVSDRQQAKYYLGHLNYYRLSGYWFPFKLSPTIDKFRQNTSFQDILNLYIFDRELRLLILNAIEQIEVSVRSKWAYHFCQKHGSHAHLNSNLFRDFQQHSEAVLSIAKSASKSKEPFIIHLNKTYDEILPPLWALVEIMTFGQLSRWFSMLKRRKDKNLVAHEYDMDEKNFGSILHHLTVVRNKCAHHNRLWNCEFTIIPTLPNKKPVSIVKSLNQSQKRKLYNTLVILIHLLDKISPSHSWKSRLIEVINKHQIDVRKMGFPEHFENLPIWH